MTCIRCSTEVDSVSRSYRCSKCETEARVERFQKLCPPLYRESDPARLPKLHDVLAWQPGQQGLLLTGPTGTGKTRCLWQLVKRLVEQGESVCAFDCVSFGHEVSKRFGDSEEAPEDWAAQLATYPIIFFDDLGKLKLTDRAEAELFGLIERRTANMKPILATTNDTGTTLQDRMTDNRGPALIRRLREFCNVIQF